MATNTTRLKLLGDELWKKNESTKVSSELLALTYGALVVQLVQDYDGDYAAVNDQLDRMGYAIGVRLIDDFLARSNLPRCRDFAEVGEVTSKVAFRSFLNTTPHVIHHPTPATDPHPSFSLVFDDSQSALNPLAEFVELPQDAVDGGLQFSVLLSGVIRGALEMIQMSVKIEIVADALKGDDTTEFRVTLDRYLEEEMPVGDD